MSPGTVVFAISEAVDGDGVRAEQLRRIRAVLQADGFDVRCVTRARDAAGVLGSDPRVVAAVIDWELEAADAHSDAAAVLRAVAERFRDLPAFLVLDHHDPAELPLFVAETVVGYVWLSEDTPGFIAGRIAHAARTYQDALLPPFFAALRRFDDSFEYSWHTPAHAGGVAFLKSPIGSAFHEYFGEQLFRSDLSVSVAELGSLFEHTGPIGAAERNAARVFGADRTYFVLGGDSAADRLVGHASIGLDEIALIDRNCHKSVLHGLVMSGARPVYLVPTRNGYGLAGPVPPSALTPQALRARIADHPLTTDAVSPVPVYSVLTNSTYDGLCYDAVRAAGTLGQSVARVHFDEAWFAYARFHPLYAHRFGMSVGPETLPGPERPTVFSTQSTHKLLAALSLSAMVHVRDTPRAPVTHDRFNEAYMMHGSTSPLYPMIASLDVATAMMDGPQGRCLIDEAVTEAVRFRRAMVHLGRRIAAAGDRPAWFFGVWQPEEVVDPATGEAVPFADAPPDLLRTDPSCWQLAPGAAWHGFPDLEEGWCLLDPVKVTITCPGTTAGGTMTDWGIPARVLTAYLETRRVMVEKTDTYSTLILFSLGITKGKWGTLLDALTDFKARYDEGAPLAEVLPEIVAAHPHRYRDLTLRDLCTSMHEHLRDAGLVGLLDDAFRILPRAAAPPQASFRRLMRGDTERVPLTAAADRVAAAMVCVTPPGIPVLLPGEEIGAADGPLLRYLRALEDFDRRFPAFGSETHGVTIDDDGSYLIEVAGRSQPSKR
ncbi:Orn/Lys/Arg decarboxylase N-terminal domain-containing protein [Embleya sp. NPDC050154]|uniref:Orn/Lys/Arg family decarboxylase n=1 Tax=Embleya sp. NPDC050154 TaxID=3363988 RepID=UPI00378BDBBD